MRKFSGQKLAEVRRARNLRREHLAVTLNRSTRSIERYESGHVCPSADVVAALADALNANLDDLYEVADETHQLALPNPRKEPK